MRWTSRVLSVAIYCAFPAFLAPSLLPELLVVLVLHAQLDALLAAHHLLRIELAVFRVRSRLDREALLHRTHHGAEPEKLRLLRITLPTM